MNNKKKSAKQMGQLIGLSSQEVNKRLKIAGYLKGEPGDYVLTLKGRKHAEVCDKDNGYGGLAGRSWRFYLWDYEVLQEISGLRFPGIDWYCDKCNAFLSGQKGFTDKDGAWECTECGFRNKIDEDQIE